MKKLILIFILCFSTSILTAQFTQPTQFNYVCDDNNDGFASFYLGEITFEILGNLNYNDYVISHHETQMDAQTNTNPLLATYYNITPYTQTIYVRIITIATSTVQIFTYQLHANPVPSQGIMQGLQVCTVNGQAQCANLLVLTDSIINGNAGLEVTYFETQMGAELNVNPIVNPGCYMSPVPESQVLYYRVTNITTGCSSIGLFSIWFTDCSPCPAPSQVFVSQVGSDHAMIDWQNGGGSSWILGVSENGGAVENITTSQSFYFLTGLNCDSVYSITVTTICTNETSIPVGPFVFATTSCVPSAGQPETLVMCSDDGSACFDLTANTPLILNSLNPSLYTVTYYNSQANANSGTAPITNPSNFCTNSNQVIFSRIENNATHDFQVVPFELIINTISPGIITLTSLDQCDDDANGSVIFNLTNAPIQVAVGASLQFYTSLANAQNQATPIANPVSYVISVQTPITTIFVRENRPDTCDVIYTFMARTYALCNLAITCANANSLCNALGTPFANTHQAASAESGNYYGCLNSQPNPTWFYLPVSAAGAINLKIEQNASIAFNAAAQDVDYIVYGPFANPVTPCSGQLTQSAIVSCSYSAEAIEYPSIPNAQFGQYYIIMVTNYSNQAGFIRITELGTTTGAIGCSGLRLNAFLDTNNNGTQEIGESNFPLGQFTSEVNNNGDVHNITSPAGTYNIYDANTSNSYDFSFAVDPNYSLLYTVNPASYSNVHVVGAGMTAYNFPVSVVQTYTDLAVNITPLSAPRPGFTYQNIISYTNNGNQTVASGTVTFNRDALVTITGNTQAGTTPTATGFTYSFTNLLPFETRSMTVTMQVPTIPTVQINWLLNNNASIAPITGDVVPSNNNANMSQIILGSYDPNDKMESHGEKILHSAFTSNDYLYYTIRFENTGTASAVNIRVTDILDSKLDETSIKMVSSSHPYVLDRLENNLTWRFANVQLPPSVANTNIGKGYVMFRIKPKAGYAVGDIIPNAASIYFDFNPAIVTNTFNTQFVQAMEVAESENGDFAFYPNPASVNVTVTLKNEGSITSIAMYDISGKLIMTQKPTAAISSQMINLSNVAKGLYLLEVTTDTNIKVVKKLLIE
jgi:uncharacterized repeat protein (TIGR01451 family)